MSFNFGAPAPVSGSGGLGTPAATAGGSAAPAATTTPAFSFGSTSVPAGGATLAFGASSAAAAAGGGFGSSSTPQAAVTGASPAPAFSFGSGGGSSTPAPLAGAASSATPAPAVAGGGGGGFSFGGTPAGSSTPSTLGVTSFGTTTTTSNNASSSSSSTTITTTATTIPTANATGPQLIHVPNFEEIFPGHGLWRKIHQVSQRALAGDSLAGQELVQMLSTNHDDKSLGSLLLQSHLVWKNNRTPNNPIRQQLAQQKEVVLRGKTGALTEIMLREIGQIAEELWLTEMEALALYAQARTKPSSQQGDAISAVARNIYFDERGQYLKTLLFLLQNRLGAANGSLYLRATDGLLQHGLVQNLLKHIQEYSQRIHGLGQQIHDIEKRGSSASMAFSTMSISSSGVTDHRKDVALAHWNFGIHEQQRAAECLFFIAYHTQWEVTEIEALVDTVQALTNARPDWPGMPVLRPLEDAPSAYDENDPSTSAASHNFPPFGYTLRREKDPLEWQQELIAQCVACGQVALLRCVATLVLTGITALDTRHVLVDRTTHALNSSGAGNSLIPTDPAASLSHLDTLRNKLNPQEACQWQRADVFGLFLAAFGLLLKESPSALLSPRAGVVASPLSGGGAWSPSETRRRLRENLEAPAELRSFTFGRLCLVPALAIPSRDLTFQNCKIEDFAWDVLAGFMARYFDVLASSPPISRQKWLVDAKEDLRLQQQSLDQYREFQRWSGTTTTAPSSSSSTQEVPSSVDVLERPDCMDDVVAFCVAVGSRGPSIAFWEVKDDLFPTDPVLQLDKMTRNDISLRAPYFALLAMLAKAEDPDNPGVCTGAAKLHSLLSRSTADLSDETLVTGYGEILQIVRHYTRELVGKGNSRSGGQATSTSSGQTGTRYYYFADGDHQASTLTSSKKSASSSSSSTQKSLGDEGTRLLVTSLALFETLASRSPDARTYLRALSLPVESSSDGIVGQDSTLMILFTLAAAQVPPEIRGHCFAAAAAILQDSNQDEALRAWDLVESAGFLPIYKLQQYPTAIGENEAPRIGFPPLTTARINDKQRNSWIPPDQSYSIIYEMEYIESALGSYPSTIGFLKLLTSLVINGGCPSTLGQNWRSRTGCAPYIEYAMGLVLPRAAGTFGGLPALPFKSTAEKHYLFDAVLELVKVAASSYLIPQTFTSNDEDKMLADALEFSKKSALKTLGMESLVDDVTSLPKKDDFKSFLNDFRPGSSISTGFQAASLPAPKSVGFTVLAAALRNDRSSLFVTLASVLANENHPLSTAEVDELQMSFALFVNLRPSFESSKSDKPQQNSKQQQNSNLSKLLVGLEHEQDSSYSRANYYLERAISSALQIICIVASKEEAFHSAVALAGLDRMVPILGFSTRQSSPTVWNLNFSRTQQKIESSGIVACLPTFLGRFRENIKVPSYATVLLFAMKESADIVRLKDRFSVAFVELVAHLVARSPNSKAFADLFSFLLVSFLRELKTDRSIPLIEALLGQDAIESLTYAASNPNLITSENSARVASLCYEAIFLLNRKLGMPRFLSDFFRTSAEMLRVYTPGVAAGECSKEILLAVSWVLKGMADQLYHPSNGAGYNLFPGAGTQNEKLRLLCEERFLVDMFHILPSEKSGYSSALSEGLHVCLGAILTAASGTTARIDLIAIISAILDKLSSDFDDATWRNVALALFIAFEHAELPQVPTADLAWALCSAIPRVPTAKAILVATLILTLRRLDTNFGDQDLIDRMLNECSETLVRMSCQVTGTFPVAPTSEAVIARTALKLLWTLASDPAIHRVLVNSAPFGRKTTPLEEMISLAARLDKDVCTLLSLVGSLSFGSDQLVEAGTLVALERGGILFLQHVESLQSQNFSAPAISAPAYLFDHLQLMNCILSSISESHLHDASLHVYRILKVYDPVLSQMLAAFPSDGNTLAEYIRCLAFVHGALQRLALHADPTSQYSLSVVPPFILRLLENPLPRSCLGPVPQILMRKNSRVATGLMEPDEQEEKSWWALLKRQQPNIQTEDICFYGVQAAEMMLSGLYIIKHATAISKTDPATLARSLIAVRDSIVFVDQCRYRCTSSTTMENLHLFRERLVSVLFELLHISIMVAQTLRQNDRDLAIVDKSSIDIRSFLTSSLDRAELEGVNYSSRNNIDEKAQKLLGELAKKLRENLR